MEIEIFGQLLLAAILGAFVGLEREIKKKEAGIQTCSLVSLGTCVFTIASLKLFGYFGDPSLLKYDPIGIIQAIAIGIGFIGAGVIFHQESGIKGLTTAAALWVIAAMGIIVGLKLYILAMFISFLTVLILAGFGALEYRFLKK